MVRRVFFLHPSLGLSVFFLSFFVWHDKMESVGFVGDLAITWERELMHAQGVRRQAASFREWLEHRRRLGSSGPEAAQADRALETCDGKSNAPVVRGATCSIDSLNTAGR